MRREALIPSIDRVYKDCKIAIESAEEIDLVVAFERGINTLQKVEPFISEALKRRNDAFRQIEWYRVSLAQDLRKEADAIIEGSAKRSKSRWTQYRSSPATSRTHEVEQEGFGQSGEWP